MRKTILLYILCLLLPFGAAAQSVVYQRYISKYSDMAIDQMRRYGIPASITLAQGLLESGAGTSRLTTKGNNHFGIKCGGTWKGPYMLVDDDAPKEKFRVYKNAKESYEDHSKFLKNGKRYAFLFELDEKDYKGWARGLKRAGYATNPAYARLLIDLIERYDLHDYDRKRHHKKHSSDENRKEKKHEKDETFDHVVYRCNGQYYVIARIGDTYASLARSMKSSEKHLREYNDVDANRRLRSGDIVYLGKKRKKADKSLNKYHYLQPGESLYSISQRFGIRLSSLCKMNPITKDHIFRVGDHIRIR